MSLPPPPEPSVGGYVGPYATSATPLPPMRSLSGLWITLLVLFALIGVTDVVAAAAFFNRARLLDELVDGGFVGSDLLDADQMAQRVFVAHALLALGLAVVFITWQFRHAKNARSLGERGGLGPGWAIGGWFIPFANYVLPGVQIFQSSRLSDPAVAAQPGRKGKGAPIVILWMVLFAVGALLFVGGGGLRPTDDEGNVQINGIEDIKDAANGDRTAGMAMILFVGAAVAGGVMVRSLSTKQTIAYETRLGGGVPPGAFGAPAAMPSVPGQWGGPPPRWSQPPPPVPPSSPPEPPTQWGTPPP